MSFDAVKCFKLKSIRLTQSSFAVHDDIDSMSIEDATKIETRRWVTHSFDVDEQKEKRLCAVVNCGLRLVRSADRTGDQDEDQDQDDSENLVIFYLVEASFRVDFTVVCDEYTDDDLEHFVAANAAHVAWPFWREHVFSALRSASLPVPEVPLMAAVKVS